MSATEEGCSLVLHSKENVVKEKAKLDGTKKGLYGTAMRKRLGDISNLPQQSIMATKADAEQLVSNANKECIDKLQKENVSLLKLLADRNKIIELCGIELEKLRNDLQEQKVNMQKMQQQNFQLAQANNLLLTEINSSKDRLKIMQFELGCKISLLKVKETELEEKVNIRACQQLDDKVGTCYREGDARVSLDADRCESKLQNTSRKCQSKRQSSGYPSNEHVELKEKTGNKRVCLRRQSARCKPEEPEREEDARVSLEADRHESKLQITCRESQSKSLGHSSNEHVELKEKTGNKRVCLRRQSARYKPKEPEPRVEDMIEKVDNAKFPVCSSLQDEKESSSDTNVDTVEFQRSSIAGPLGSATQKLQAYKKVPVNVKMRRQSARYKPEEPERQEEDMIVIIDDAKFPMCASLQDEKEGSNDTNLDTVEFQRSSIARPLRSAAKKVQSYKEIPLNVKMRRPE